MTNPTYEELELQVDVLRELLEEVFIGFVDYVEGGEEDEVMAAIKQAIADTSETARRHDARVKKETRDYDVELFATLLHFIPGEERQLVADVESLIAELNTAGKDGE